MARLIYPDLAALIELQLDVLAGEYAAERDYDTRSEIPCAQRDYAHCKHTETKKRPTQEGPAVSVNRCAALTPATGLEPVTR